MKLPMQHWGVVGGGILGMVLAHRLSQRGMKVTLLEAAEQLGGLAAPWKLADVVWDRHYHVTLRSDTHLRSLLAELGLEKEIQWVETRTGFYTDGELFSMSNALEFLRFRPLGFLDKLRLGCTILYASRVRNWKRLERIAVADWLRRWSGKRTFERIWLPLLRAKLGENYRKASAAFIWATIARMYRARRTGLKKELFGYVPGGYARILKRFSGRLCEQEVSIRLCEEVRKVDLEGDGRIRVELGSQSKMSFDQVVVTVPAPIAVELCPRLSEDEKARLKGVVYQGIICASLLLKRPLGNFYVTNITDSWVPFTAVIEMSALVDRTYFGGNSLVYLPKYVASDDPAFGVPDKDIEEQFLDAVARMYPHHRRTDVLCFRISRVRYVHAFSTLHYSDRLPPMRTSMPGLFIVNSGHIVNGTLNVNETIGLADTALGELLRSVHL